MPSSFWKGLRLLWFLVPVLFLSCLNTIGQSEQQRSSNFPVGTFGTPTPTPASTLAATSTAARPTRQDTTAPVSGGVDFQYTTLEGKTRRFSEFRGRPAVVLASDGVVQPTALIRLVPTYTERGVRFLGVGLTPPREDRFQRMSDGLSIPFTLDRSGEIAQALGVSDGPTYVFISRQGDEVSRWRGAITTINLEERIQELSPAR